MSVHVPFFNSFVVNVDFDLEILDSDSDELHGLDYDRIPSEYANIQSENRRRTVRTPL